jgi:hypothetical protein
VPETAPWRELQAQDTMCQFIGGGYSHAPGSPGVYRRILPPRAFQAPKNRKPPALPGASWSGPEDSGLARRVSPGGRAAGVIAEDLGR